MRTDARRDNEATRELGSAMLVPQRVSPGRSAPMAQTRGEFRATRVTGRVEPKTCEASASAARIMRT